MVTSIYIKSYYEWLSALYQEQGIDFDKTLLYVPNNSPESMIDFLVRKELVKRNANPGEQVAFMGFNRSVINAAQGTRPNSVARSVLNTQTASSRHMRKVMFELSTFIVTNKANLAEDIEEIYNVFIKHRSTYEADMESVFEQDYPEFRVNIIHSDITDTTPIDQQGNLWGIASTAQITAPAFSLAQTEITKAREISLYLYQMNVVEPKAAMQITKIN